MNYCLVCLKYWLIYLSGGSLGGGHTLWYSGLTPDPVFRDHSGRDLGNHMWCQGLKPVSKASLLPYLSPLRFGFNSWHQRTITTRTTITTTNIGERNRKEIYLFIWFCFRNKMHHWWKETRLAMIMQYTELPRWHTWILQGMLHDAISWWGLGSTLIQMEPRTPTCKAFWTIS